MIIMQMIGKKNTMFWFFLLFSCAAVMFCDENVKYAAIIFRHGDSTPISPYPKDPWNNESLWPVKFGKLTNVGKNTHYKLGIWLRKRYSHLLSKNFDPTEIYIRSTDVDRTLMSAQMTLAGLYSHKGDTVWSTDMWKPMPVYAVPENDDDMLAMKKPCPAFDKAYSGFLHSKFFTDGLSKYQTLMNYLSSYTGMIVKTYFDIYDIYSTLYIEQLNNFSLPNWTDSVFPDKMREPACNSFTTQTATPLLARLKVGPLLKQIHTHLMEAVTGEAGGKHRKVQLYSAHDLNIGSMLNALGMYDGNCPCYTSAIFFELLLDNSTHYVRISYRNFTDIEEPLVLHIPNCSTKCPVDRFAKLYKNILSVDWANECNKKTLTCTDYIGLYLLSLICVFAILWYINIYILHENYLDCGNNSEANDSAFSTLEMASEPSTMDTVKIIETYEHLTTLQ